MMQIARSWRVAVAGLAVGVVGVLRLCLRHRVGRTGVSAPAQSRARPRTAGDAAGRHGRARALSATPSPADGGRCPRRCRRPTSPALAPAAAAAGAAARSGPSPGRCVTISAARASRWSRKKRQNFTALDITLPMPPGWTQVPDPNVPDAFVVIANRRSASLYTSNAQVVVYRLIGDFDPKEAITHGYLDSPQLLAWQTTNASLADFDGSPSSIIEGTYRENEMTLNTSRRHVIVSSGPDKYLVSLAVTTDAAAAVAEAPATDAIVNGFRAGPPGPTHPPLRRRHLRPRPQVQHPSR